MSIENSPKQRRKGGGLALIVAVLALLLALVSTFFSWRAAGKAADTAGKIDALVAAQSNAPAPQPVTPTTDPAVTDPPTDPAATTEPAPAPTGAVTTLDAQTQYKLKYPDKQLTIPSSCGRTTYVDFDEPRVQVDGAVAEIFYYAQNCSTGTGQMRLSDGVAGSEMPSGSATPVECANQIQTSPLQAGKGQPLRRGQVFCITSSQDAAARAAIPWRLVIFSVTAIGQDGTVTLKASAWDVPA